MLGDSGVGKTSLVYRWTKDDFNPCLVGTVGVDFKVKKINVDGEWILVQVWDTAGQEQFHRITQTYYRGAHAIMLVYDISDRKTLESVEYWMKNIKSHASGGVHTILVGNKLDMRETSMNTSDGKGKQYVEYSDGEIAAAKRNVLFFETSAKTAMNVDETFMTVAKCILAGEKSNSSTEIIPPEETKSKEIISSTNNNSNNHNQINNGLEKKNNKPIMNWLRKNIMGNR